MKYSNDEFFRLMTEVEKIDGSHLDETHTHAYVSSWTGDQEMPPMQVTYCDQNTLFAVPYDDGTHAGAEITVCAIDDCIGLWPRFKDANAPGSNHEYLPI